MSKCKTWMGDKSPCSPTNCCHSGNCNKNGKCQACELTNGFCGGLKGCVGGKSCGVNMEGPSTCEKSPGTFCFFNKDCGNYGPCKVKSGDHQHINKTCADLLKETSRVKGGVQCNPGYKAGVVDSTDGNGGYRTPINKNSKRQPCQFVCNKIAPAPSPSPSPPKKKKKKKLSKSDIAVIIVGSVLGLSIIGVTIFMLVKLK